ncbi:MAG: ankyrin repeat domain-containing protein [Bdellovibrionales bacterium]
MKKIFLLLLTFPLLSCSHKNSFIDTPHSHNLITRKLKDPQQIKENTTYLVTLITKYNSTESSNKEEEFNQIKKTIQYGVNLNQKYPYDRTPLMWAAFLGPIEVVELLIESGSDLSTQDNQGHTALDYAKDPEIRSLIQQQLSQNETQKK